MKSSEIRQKFLDFFEKRGHAIRPSSSLSPTDPSVLFTTAGMQQFKPYYLGEKSPWGPNIASVQKCIRTSDIDEVGDEHHLTFFEMLGNFSFGGYFKEEAIKLAHEFITKKLGLNIDYVTVFSPNKVLQGDWRKGVAEDVESYEIWKKYVPKEKIRKEGVDNFWGPTGDEGPCGPTTEIYVNGIEIWNIVFNEFFVPMISHAKSENESYDDLEKRLSKERAEKLEKLETSGVDTGMGLERLAMVVQKVPTVFETDLFEPIIAILPTAWTDVKVKRIIADHVRAIVFLISDGVIPSNKDQGYILRRLMRTVASCKNVNIENLVEVIINKFKDQYPNLDKRRVISEFEKERDGYERAYRNTEIEIKKHKGQPLTGIEAFGISSTLGVRVSDVVKIAESANVKIIDNFDKEFEEALKKHQELSRTASAGMFKGGLADHKPETIRLHTAHHLLLAALQELFGKSVKQKGSNINSERLRIDFSFERRLTDEEKKEIEGMVNEKVKEGLDVVKKKMPKEEAEKTGAEMEFGVKYGNTVSVYFIQDKSGNIFSKEFCGGPHVRNTSELGRFKIIKEEAVSSGVRRIKAILD